MKFRKIQEDKLEEKLKGRKLIKVSFIKDQFNFTFDDKTTLKSKSFTPDMVDWIRRQQGQEKEYVDLIFETLNTILK